MNTTIFIALVVVVIKQLRNKCVYYIIVTQQEIMNTVLGNAFTYSLNNKQTNLNVNPKVYLLQIPHLSN